MTKDFDFKHYYYSFVISLIVVNEVQKIVHLYLDHVEPWYFSNRNNSLLTYF